MTGEPEGRLRPLTPEELDLLRWMFANGSEDLRTFEPQLNGMLASSWCDCGCPAPLSVLWLRRERRRAGISARASSETSRARLRGENWSASSCSSAAGNWNC